jgi:predicted nucleic acid-binding protein
VTLYADASALVKRYVVEQFSTEVDELIDAADEVISASITRVEAVAAIAKRVREVTLDRDQAAAAVAELNTHWAQVREVIIDAAVIDRACHLAWQHSLRGYDAVQLAAALRIRDIIQAPLTVAAFDQRLRAGCTAEGLTIWPPVLP